MADSPIRNWLRSTFADACSADDDVPSLRAVWRALPSPLSHRSSIWRTPFGLRGRNREDHVRRSLSALATLAIVLGSTFAAPQPAAAGGGSPGLQSLALIGSGGFVASPEGT